MALLGTLERGSRPRSSFPYRRLQRALRFRAADLCVDEFETNCAGRVAGATEFSSFSPFAQADPAREGGL